jgi:hypothetical protein
MVPLLTLEKYYKSLKKINWDKHASLVYLTISARGKEGSNMKITLPLLLRQKQRLPSFSEKPFQILNFPPFFKI